MKHGKYFFVLAVLVILFTALASQAMATKIFLNGKRIILDTEPVERNGMIFVPLRGIFEKMGAMVDFEKSTQMITAVKKNISVKLMIGNPNAIINGSRTRLFQAPFEMNSRTYVPLRFISESLGCRVGWHPPSKTVAISTNPEKDPLSELDKDDLKPETPEDNNSNKINAIKKPEIKGIDKLKTGGGQKGKKKDNKKDDDDPEKDINIDD
jgi:hypothetical protein